MKKPTLIICLTILILGFYNKLNFIFSMTSDTQTISGVLSEKRGLTSDIEKIVFYSSRSGNAQIYIMNTDGSDLQRLTTNNAKDLSPDISPDGRSIVFASDREGESHIYVMNTDGSNQYRLTDTKDVEILPSWSPDGKRIYYQVEPENENSFFCSVKADGSDFKRITDGSRTFNYINISPDGKEIVCNSPNFEVYTMEIDGSNQKRIGGIGKMRMIPHFSPDGTTLVYGLLTGSPPNHRTEIGIINSDGSQDKVITNNNSINEFACWSPDGKKIAFQTAQDGNFEIYVMNADGSDQQRITNDPGFDGAPSWGVVRLSN